MSSIDPPAQLSLQDVIRQRRSSQLGKLLLAFAVFVLVLWSIDATIIADTDWERIGGLGSILKSLGRFRNLDL